MFMNERNDNRDTVPSAYYDKPDHIRNFIIFPFFRFGRKPTLCASFVCLIAVAVSVAWTPSIEVYMFQSALIGFFVVGMFMPVFVVGMFTTVKFVIITLINQNNLKVF